VADEYGMGCNIETFLIATTLPLGYIRVFLNYPEEVGFFLFNFPNPFNSTHSVDYPIGTKSISIYSLDGRVLLKSDVDRASRSIVFSFESFESGVYAVRLETEKGFLVKKAVYVR
jgi:hypothetical protein